MMASGASDAVPEPLDSAALKALHARLDAQGLFAPSRFWTRKLLLWIPTFFLSYLGLFLLPFGAVWLILAVTASVGLLTMGYVGHDAGHFALSRRGWVNNLWGQLGMTFLCGMS